MPTRTRPARSLLALALVVNLFVAGAPETAMGHQPDAPRPATPPQRHVQPRRCSPRTPGASDHHRGRGDIIRGLRASIAPLSPPPSG